MVSSVLSPNSGLQTKHDLVISNDTRGGNGGASGSGGGENNTGAYSKLKNNLLLVNNTVPTTTSDFGAPAAPPRSLSPKPEKNVNIDRFKLGGEEAMNAYAEPPVEEAEEEAATGGCSSEADPQRLGACAKTLDEDEDEGRSSDSDPNHPKEEVPFDINLYQTYDVTSPSKEKDNTKLADLYRKISKANVDVAIINNSNPGGAAAMSEQKEEEEEEEDLKIFVHK